MRSNFNFRGSKIYFRQQGKGRAIILLHGFLANHQLWEAQFTDLSRSYRLIAMDLPGHGRSENLGYLHTMELLAEMVNALIRHLKLRKVVLIGHSLGGYIALAFAEKYTDKIKGLILVNSTASADTPRRKASRKKMIGLLPKSRKKVLKALVKSFFVIPSFQRPYLIRSYERWALDCHEQSIVATMRGMMQRKEREIILKFAPYPFLIIAGESDPIIDIQQSIIEAELSKNGRLEVFEDSGHMSVLESPWFLNRKITEFLRKELS